MLLPQPVGPTTLTNSPAPTVSVTSRTAAVALRRIVAVDEGAADPLAATARGGHHPFGYFGWPCTNSLVYAAAEVELGVLQRRVDAVAGARTAVSPPFSGQAVGRERALAAMKASM